MTPALRDYALLWSTAIASRDMRSKWAFWLITAISPLLVGLLIFVKTGSLLETFWFAARVPVAVVLFAALTVYVPGAIRLNTPANARLVPRMRRRLIELTVLVWAGGLAVAVLMATDTPVPAAMVAMVALVWLVGLGLASAGYQIGTVIQSGLVIGVVARQYVPAILFEPVSAGAIGLLLLALAARTLDLMFPNGGDRHWERRHAQVRAIERSKPEGMMRQASTGMSFGGALYAAALRRNSTPRRAPAFLLPVLAPAMHWTQRYLPLLTVVGAAVVIVILARTFASDAVFDTRKLVLGCLAMLFAQLFTYEQRRIRLTDTRSEQALLRLAPAVPAAARQFNRQLNGALLRMAVLDWAVICAALLIMSVVLGAHRDVLMLTPQVCCLTLPLVAANVRDHARESGSGVLRLAGGLAGALGISFGCALLVQKMAGTPVMPVAAGVGIVLAVVVVVWRWRAAVSAPHAFPAARLA